MTEQQIEPCLICDGKMKHTQADEANHWFCSNYNVCGYDLIDDEASIEDHNERYGIIRLGKQAPTLLRQRDELVDLIDTLVNEAGNDPSVEPDESGWTDYMFVSRKHVLALESAALECTKEP